MLTDGQSFLVAVFTLSLFYGVYLVTLIQCFRWLLFTDEGWKLRGLGKIDSVMTSATVAISLASTINLICTIKFAINVYVRVRTARDMSLYADMMVADVCWVVARLLIDGILVYRCWIVYAKSWWGICIPLVFWIASLGCSVLNLYYVSLTSTHKSAAAEQDAFLTVAGLYGCSIVTTVYTTSAIIHRIWRSSRETEGGHQRLIYTMRILAESGILYTVTLIFDLIGTVIAVESNHTSRVKTLVYDLSDAISLAMANISFNLILIRVYKSRVEDTGIGEQSVSKMQFQDNTQITESSFSDEKE